MSDPQSNSSSGSGEISKWLEPGKQNAQLIYILYFASFLIGISGLIGVVIAYMNRGKAGDFVETHYTWLIRTFWIGILYALVAAILAFVVIGVILMFAVAVWVIVRLVKGLQALGRNEPISDPQTWWI